VPADPLSEALKSLPDINRLAVVVVEGVNAD
jgi:hypothetical protein